MVEAYTASWIEMKQNVPWGSLVPVEAYTASWIEMCMIWTMRPMIRRRGLYSLVD